MHVLFIDNFDSFTFNLVDELAKRGAHLDIWRNDLPPDRALELALALPTPRLIVLSPGPGTPAEAGCCIPLIQRALTHRIPLFGICLGHQALTQALGGTVGGAGTIVHGKSSAITHDGSRLFAGIASPMTVGRYHSLMATSLPEELIVRAQYGDIVMAVEHQSAPLAGVQFHPESILTPEGGKLLENVLDWARDASGSAHA